MKLFIKTTSQISLKELLNLKEQGVGEIDVQLFHGDGIEVESLDIETVIKIKSSILSILGGIPSYADDDPDREKKIFSYVYCKLAQTIVYDDWASVIASDKAELNSRLGHLVDQANGLYGLITGKSLCGGYSNILINVLSECGIEAKYVSGGGRKRGGTHGSHAWNQVCLDGIWYNCDLTNDVDFIENGLKLPFFLKSNKEFGEKEFNRYEKYPVVMDVKECMESVNDQEQEMFIDEVRRIWAERAEKARIAREQEEARRLQEEKEATFKFKLKKFFASVFSPKRQKTENVKSRG